MANIFTHQKIQHKKSSNWMSLGMSATLLFLSACATTAPMNQADKDAAANALPPPKALNEVLADSVDDSAAPHQVQMTDSGEIIVRGIKLKNTKFDFPVTINSRVEYWIDYFTGRGRGYFAKYLERSEFFIPYIAPVLKQNNMPQDLVYLAMIESGFNNLARSHAKAVGPWQFISATGKRYGLMVNWWVDERRDVRKSTLAAVEYLRDLHGMFNSWELAAASYNAGEAKIARAVQRFGTKDFWVIARQRFLRPETRDYVPKIIAAAIVSKNRTQFGFEESHLAPSADEAIAGDGEVVKVIKTDKPEEQLDPADQKGLVAELEQDARAGDPNADAKADMDDDDDNDDDAQAVAPTFTPATLTVQAPQATPTPDKQPLAKPVPMPQLTKDGKVGGVQLAEFDVQSPADLLKVARAAGLSYQTVKSLNPELMRWCTPPRVTSYRLRLPEVVKDKFLSTYNHISFPRKVEFAKYKVQRGETLSRIASRYGIKVDPMSDLNGLSAKMPLRLGAQVLLPIPNDRSRSMASLDVRDPPESRHSSHRRRRHHRVSYHRRETARARLTNNS
jgi:soluble lytic murein transglycosylase-like protein